MSIRGIILAGGSSKRMGENKLQMEIEGQTIVSKAISNAKKSKLDELLLVYGKYEVDTDIKKIYNENHEMGMSTSIIKGLKGFEGEAIMILLGDMPFVSSEIINRLIDGFTGSMKNIVVPVCAGKKGNPVIIGKKYYDALLNNSGDKGAREIVKNNASDTLSVEINSNGIFIDIDEKSVYERICSEIEHKAPSK